MDPLVYFTFVSFSIRISRNDNQQYTRRRENFYTEIWVYNQVMIQILLIKKKKKSYVEGASLVISGDWDLRVA